MEQAGAEHPTQPMPWSRQSISVGAAEDGEEHVLSLPGMDIPVP